MKVANLLNNFTAYKDMVVCRVITVVNKNPLVLERGLLTHASRIPTEYLNKEVIMYTRRELTNYYIELEVYV